MILPQSVFCCCNLRMGGLILGWTLSISSIIQLAVSIPYTYALANANSQSETNSDIITLVQIASVVWIISSLVGVFTCFCLIRGIYTKKRRYFLPWLLTVPVGIWILTFIGGTFGSLVFISSSSGPISAFYIVLFIIIGFEAYFWLCILSLYQEFQKEEFNGNVSQMDN